MFASSDGILPKGNHWQAMGSYYHSFFCITNHSHLDFISFQHRGPYYVRVFVLVASQIPRSAKAVQAGKTEFRQRRRKSGPNAASAVRMTMEIIATEAGQDGVRAGALYYEVAWIRRLSAHHLF